MSITSLPPSSPPADQWVVKQRVPVWLVAICIVALAGLCGLGWFGWWLRTDLQQTQTRLEALSHGVQTLAEKQDEINSDLRHSREQTRLAEERAGMSEQARAQAARQAEQAQAAKAAADQQAEQARQQAQGARQELDQIRKARQDELNRMQEALSKVALTRRTANGMVVDLTNDSFKFDFDKATLRPENRELLSRLAGVLLVSHGYRLDVYGYTDDVGTDSYNQGLSERRAQAVRDYLVKAGIPADILTIRGFGKSSPRARAKTADAREKNRRVEIGIVDTVIKYGEETHP